MFSKYATKTNFDLGSIIHYFFGFLAVILGHEYLFTIVFIIKQLGDAFLTKEDWSETSGDIIEYMAGFITGVILLKLFP